MVKHRAGSAYDEEWRLTVTAVDDAAQAAKAKATKVQGSNASETINGTSLAELIDGKGGDDRVFGKGNDDVLKGGKGDDEIVGDGDVIRSILYSGGNDQLDGSAGNDTLDGGFGDDVVKGGSGDDYVFGGYGGRDLIDGGSGNDRVGGGFLAPNAGSGAEDNDIVVGGSGADIFEARTWVDYGRSGYATPGLSLHQDVVLDFTRGEDRIDTVLYRFDGSSNTFRRGGFELFDSNRNGELDDGDAWVAIRQVTANGQSKLSTVLDVGNALKAAGLVGSGEIDAGPHELTLHGVTGLDADDFVPTKTYTAVYGSSGSFSGGSADEWLYGGTGGQVITGNGGNDLYFGRGGRDTFVVGQGRDEIMDFLVGDDKLQIWLNGSKVGFSQLDSNGNGELDDGDAKVEVSTEQMLAPGEIPTVGEATYIDLGGGNSVLLYGTTGIGASDFA